MSTNSHHNIEDKEIDLSVVSRGIRDFFQNLNIAIFKAIQFVIKHIVILVILFVIGISLGIYFDSKNKTYSNQIIVKPNFESTDYLYAKIDLIQSKIKERDTVFLKSIGLDGSNKISNIEITPVLDVYKFINENNGNLQEKKFELLKLMAEDGDINKIVEDKITSKNYKYHIISFQTKGKTNAQKSVKPLLNFLNQNNFFLQSQKIFMQNVKLKMQANEVIIGQIDGILNNFANKLNAGSTNERLVYNNENIQLSEIINTKENLIREQGYYRLELYSSDKIIKDTSSTLNTKSNDATQGKLKLILPILLILIYLVIYSFISFYKSQKLKYVNQ